MPELPEVETIRRGLSHFLVGKQIQSIEVKLPRIVSGDVSKITFSEIVGVRRFGKGLIIDFENEVSLACHVKMTGQFIFKDKETENNFHPQIAIVGELPNKWTHVVFTFLEGDKLFYNDIRQFGWMKVVPTNQISQLPFFKNLGPEPFGDLTEQLFISILSLSNLPVKNLLMDQQKIGGVGNIYANEALFMAKINPLRKASSLTKIEGKALYKSLLEVLQMGLKYGGASDVNYIHVDGTTGQFQHHFQVYRKHGKACPRCMTIIERIVVGGRGTFICPKCQL